MLIASYNFFVLHNFLIILLASALCDFLIMLIVFEMIERDQNQSNTDPGTSIEECLMLCNSADHISDKGKDVSKDKRAEGITKKSQ